MKIKNIAKTVNLNKKNFDIIRRIVVIFSFASICAILAMMVFGAVPLRERSMSVIAAVSGVLEFVNIGRAAFGYTAASVAFSVFYFYIIVRIVIDIILCLKNVKKWMISNEDNKENRKAVSSVVVKANACIFRYLTLLTLSYLVSAYKLHKLHFIFVCVIVIGSLAVNIAKNLLYKGELVDSIVIALNRHIILISAIMLVFLSHIQIFDVFYALGRMFTSLETGSANASFGGQLFCNSVLRPVFYFITWICLVVFSQKINSGDFEDESSVRKVIIMNVVYLVLFMVILGWTQRSTDVFAYFDMIWENITLIAIMATTYIASMNVYSEYKDIHYVKDDNSEE